MKSWINLQKFCGRSVLGNVHEGSILEKIQNFGGINSFLKNKFFFRLDFWEAVAHNHLR